MPTESSTRREALFEGLAVTLVLTVGALCAWVPIGNGDVWWHVVVGNWIAENGALPSADVWSSEPGGTWYSFSWLYQILVSAFDGIGGMPFVRAASATGLTLSLGLVYGLYRRAGATRSTALLLVAVLLLAFQYRIRHRPHLVNLAAFAVLSMVVCRGHIGRKHAVAAALGFAVWASLHAGGAMIAAGAVVVLVIVTLINRPAPGPRSVALMTAIAALIGWIVTPGSFRTVMVVAGNQGATIASIGEWSSTLDVINSALEGGLHAWTLRLVWPGTALVVVASALRHRHQLRGPRGYSVALAAYYLVVSLLWFRLYFLAAFAVALAVLPTEPSPTDEPRPHPLGMPRLVAALTVFALCLHFTTVTRFGSLSAALEARSTSVQTSRFPIMATDLLVSSDLELRVAAPDAWSGYVLYQGWPNLTVTSDGRNAAADEVLEAHAAIQHILETGERPDLLPLLYSALPADVLVMPTPCFMGSRDTGEWVLVGTAQGADVYLRRDEQFAERMQALQNAMRE